MRSVIVNADDFGVSDGVNRGIIAAHEHGVVTSTSLMVRRDAAVAAARYAQGRPSLGLGLHLDLGEWVQVARHDWQPTYEVVSLEDEQAVRAEVERQLEQFRTLVGRDPTHIDSHQHVHKEEPARSAARALADRLSVPLRHFGHVRYCGEFYGQDRDGSPLHDAITAEALVAVIERLPPGVTEVACHPGDDEGLASSYRAERMLELAALCDPRVRAAFDSAQVRLRSFADV